MFSIQNLTHQYPQQTLTFPDWQTEQGTRWLLTGASGSGKTTLLHMLAGLLRPATGRVRVAGTSLYEQKSTQTDRFRGRQIGLVLQRPHLLPTLTVEENLLLAQYLAGLRQERTRIAQVLHVLQIQEKRHSLPGQLSQGQAQRVSIARAVLNRPRLILADEPTSSLDDENCRRVLALLEEQAQDCEATLVIATHDGRLKSQYTRQFHLQTQAGKVIV